MEVIIFKRLPQNYRQKEVGATRLLTFAQSTQSKNSTTAGCGWGEFKVVV